VPAGRTSDAIFSTLDLLPTFGRLAGYDVPTDRHIDGVDQTDLLLGNSETGNRDTFYYFSLGELHGVRKGRWKLLLAERTKYFPFVKDRGSKDVELYDLSADISETTNLADAQPDLVQEMLELAHALPLPDEPYHTGIGPPRPSDPPASQ
jgi:arylsulfatase A-like enzyme